MPFGVSGIETPSIDSYQGTRRTGTWIHRVNERSQGAVVTVGRPVLPFRQRRHGAVEIATFATEHHEGEYRSVGLSPDESAQMLLNIKKLGHQVSRSAERRQLNIRRGHLPPILGIQRHQDMKRVGKSIHQSHAGHPTQARRHMAEKRRLGRSGQRRHHGSRPAAMPDHRRAINAPLEIVAAEHQISRCQLIRWQLPFQSDVELPTRERIQDHALLNPFVRSSTIRMGG